MTLLDDLTGGLGGDGIFLLNCIGAIKFDDEGKVSEYCIYNLSPILQEVEDFIIPCLREFAENSDLEEIDEKLANGVRLLKGRIGDLKLNIKLQSEVSPNLANRKLMQGYMLDFPLFSLIPYATSLPFMTEKFRQYKGLLILCAFELNRHAAAKNKNYTAALKGAAAALRLVTESALLVNLPQIDGLSIEEIYEKFADISIDEGFLANQTETQYIRALTAVFRFVAEKTGGTLRKKRDIQTDIDSSEKNSNIRIRSTRASEYFTPVLRVAKKSGLALAELASDIELITLDYVSTNFQDEDVSPSEPMQTLARQALSRQRQLEGIEKGAQLLPISTNRLTPGEIAVFIETTEKVINTQNQSMSQIEAVAAMQTSFWLSKSLQESLNLTIYKNQTNLPKAISAGFIGYLQESLEWVIPSAKPKGAPKHKGVNLSAALPVQEIIRLPDVTGAHEYLSRLNTWKKAKLSEEGCKAFESSGGIVESNCKNILKEIKKDTHGRVTAGRLKDAVFLSLLDECQDKATAILALARHHRLGDTQLHYLTLRISKLQKYYIETCRKIVGNINSINNTISLSLQNLNADAAGYEFSEEFAGCPICPSGESIKKVVLELRQEIERKRHSMTGAQSRVDFFNLYTSYTIFFLWHLTGIRAVTKPIPSMDYIDFENALLLASDKDDYTSFNTRLVPISSVLLQQLKYYFSFRKNYFAKYQLQFPKHAGKFKEKLEKENHFFYFIELKDERQNPIETSPAAVMDQIRKISPWFGLPENCQRPRLRSLLLERDCHPLWIDALLGHWARGEEPWHRFASTALFKITEGLRAHLEAIAVQDGWKALQGGAQ